MTDTVLSTATPAPRPAPAGAGLGLALSGGGNRSAAFSIGVLQALHERGWLSQVGVVSAVSGGTYALSWLLLQPFHRLSHAGDAQARLAGIWAEMFDVDGCYQKHLADEAKPFAAGSRVGLLLQGALAAALDQVLNPFRLLLGGSADAANIRNASSLVRKAYREGIQNTYQRPPTSLGTMPERRESWSETALKYGEHLKLTGMDVPQIRFPQLLRFARDAGLPEFVFNATLQLRQSGDGVPLASRIFEISSTGFGSDSCGFLSWAETEGKGWEPGDGLPSGGFFARRPDVSPWATLRCANVASAISGAAVTGMALKGLLGRFLLHVLNIGLEYHVPNPADPKRTVCLSDGGHSENLGLFALLRRGCRTVLVVDAEHDPGFEFGAYRKIKAAALDELGVSLELPDLDSPDGPGFDSKVPFLVGRIQPREGPEGRLIYLKLAMDPSFLGSEAGTTLSFARRHAGFPQETTVDQYFEPAQFKAYRALGRAAGHALPRDLCSATPSRGRRAPPT